MLDNIVMKVVIALLCIGVVVGALCMMNIDVRHPLYHRNYVPREVLDTLPHDTALARTMAHKSHLFSTLKPSQSAVESTSKQWQQIAAYHAEKFEISPESDSCKNWLTPTSTMLVDSDSISQYSLFREQRAAVHIDLTEHKDKWYFTWDDMKTWWRIIADFYENKFKKG